VAGDRGKVVSSSVKVSRIERFSITRISKVEDSKKATGKATSKFQIQTIGNDKIVL